MNAVNRATSAYTLRVPTPGERDQSPALFLLVTSVADETPVTDQHNEPAAYVSVSYRGRGDDAALGTATRVLAEVSASVATSGATLTTGLGVHRRTVAIWGEEEGPLFCRWFALCDHLATGTLSHPVLGEVPICDRCRAKAEQ